MGEFAGTELTHLRIEASSRRIRGGAGDRLLKVGDVKEIYEMKGAGNSIRGIARGLDISRNTVRRYLNTPEAIVAKPRRRRVSKLDSFTEYIDRWLSK